MALLPNPWIIIGVGIAFLLAVTGAYLKGHSNGAGKERAAQMELQAKLDKLAQDTILSEQRKTAAAERALAEHKAEVEKQNAERDKYVHGLRLANGRLVAAHGGLFDKNGRPRPQGGEAGSGGSAGAVGGSNAPGVGCTLSGQVTEHLLDLARDADLDRNTALACQADLAGTTAILRKLAEERNREAVPD